MRSALGSESCQNRVRIGSESGQNRVRLRSESGQNLAQICSLWGTRDPNLPLEQKGQAKNSTFRCYHTCFFKIFPKSNFNLAGRSHESSPRSSSKVLCKTIIKKQFLTIFSWKISIFLFSQKLEWLVNKWQNYYFWRLSNLKNGMHHQTERNQTNSGSSHELF